MTMTPIGFGVFVTLPVLAAMMIVHLIFGALTALPM